MVLISLLTVAIYFSASSTLKLDRSNRNARSLNIGDYFLYATAILTNQGILTSYPIASLDCRKSSLFSCFIAFPFFEKRSRVLAILRAIKIVFPFDGWCLVPVCLGYGERLQRHTHGPHYC